MSKIKYGGALILAGNSYKDFVVRHSVCSQTIAVEGDAIGGGTGVHCIDLPREQPIMDTPESSYGTKKKKKRELLLAISHRSVWDIPYLQVSLCLNFHSS